ncbi:MAG: VWA domain-containing protein [Candidatus Omnitrophica bacterium]|nr:VWA domain-containing protein [Candidatus Omnitrophota bacterium]
MRNKRPKIVSICFSLACHSIFVFWATGMYLPAIQNLVDRKLRNINVKLNDETNKKDLATESASYQFNAPPGENYKFIEPSLDQQIEKKASSIKTDPTKTLALAKPDDISIPHKITLEPQILKRTSKRPTEDQTISVTRLLDEESYSNLKKDLAVNGITEDFLDKMPGFTPALPQKGYQQSKSGQGAMSVKRKHAPLIKRTTTLDSLSDKLDFTLSTFHDRKDNQKYFQITIRTNQQADLPTLKKEVVFLVDSSSSIQTERMEEFKEGLRAFLAELNPDDIFNIIAFKEKIRPFQKKSVQPTETNIQDALKFVNNLKAAKKTNTYQALLKTMKKKTTRDPAYIILLSDGRPTKGMTDSQEMINKIAKKNKGKTSIFALSGGVHVNRYLLDFIAYKNRGWSEYAGRTHQIDDTLKNFSKKIKNPIILYLRYYISGVDMKETFPKSLPDLFRGAEFTLYGKYEKEDKVVMQLLGHVQNKTKEFIVEGNFNEAQDGDAQIAKNWAYNKIYHLIGLLKYNKNNASLLQEINQLAEKFDIKTPYQKITNRKSKKK